MKEKDTKKQKAGKARWENVSAEKRSLMMKKLAKQRQRKYVLVLRTEYEQLLRTVEICKPYMQ